MPVVSPIREVVVTFGHCVSSPDVYPDAIPETFAKIDTGNRQKSLLEAAARACLTCPQYADYCHPGREAFATKLWLEGAGVLFSGGKNVHLETGETPADLIDEPQMRWDLLRISDKPDIAVLQMQRAVRSGQFRMVGNRPKGSVTEAENFKSRLVQDEADPDFYAKVYEPLGDEARIGAEYMITALCQQKDWARFSQQNGKGGNPKTMDRYDPGTLDTAVTDPIIKQYLCVALEIQELGYSAPANKALRFPSAFYGLLKDKYFSEEIGWPEFDKIVSTARNNPVVAVQRRLGKQSRILAEAPDAPATYVEKAARGSSTANFNDRVDALAAKYKGDRYVTRGVVRDALSHSPTNPESIINGYTYRVTAGLEKYLVRDGVIVEDEIIIESDVMAIARNTRSEASCLNTLRRFRHNMKVLMSLYYNRAEDKLDEDFTDSRLRLFARANIQLGLDTTENAKIARTAAREYKQRVASLKLLAEGTLPDWHIRKLCADNGPNVTYAQASQAYKILTVTNRLNKRVSESAEELTGLDSSTVKRIVALYPESEVDMVADTVFKLVNAGLLVMARGERNETRDLTWQHELDKIQDPKNHKYLTFSAALAKLVPDRRLAFAHHYNLMPLLYGTASNTFLLEQEVYEDWDLDTLFESVIGPNCEGLLAESTHPELPIPEYLINNDLRRFKGLLESGSASQTEAPEISLTLQGVQKSLIVAGGRLFLLRERDAMKSWDKIDENIKTWVEKIVNSAYPPQHSEQMMGVVVDALQHGVLTLLGTSPREYQLAFSSAFYEENTDDLDRAVIAHELGLDRLIYGSNLGEFLCGRIGDSELSMRLKRTTSPSIHDVTDSILPQLASDSPPATSPAASPPARAGQREQQADSTGSLPEKYTAVNFMRATRSSGSRHPGMVFPPGILERWGLDKNTGYYYASSLRMGIVVSSRGLQGDNVSKCQIRNQRRIPMPPDLVKRYGISQLPIGIISWSGEQTALVTASARIALLIGSVSIAGMGDDDRARINAFAEKLAHNTLQQAVELDFTEMEIAPDVFIRAAFPELEGVYA